jgi:hypothetical protein
MDEDKLIELLKNNLRVEVSQDTQYDYYGTSSTSVSVTIYYRDIEISSGSSY